jgi:hypothetical protein
MKTLIERVHHANLRNNEFSTVYNQTLVICEKHDMEALHLEKSFEELKSFAASIDAMSVAVWRYEKLSFAGELDMERDRLSNALYNLTKHFGNADLPEIRGHIDLLIPIVEKHKTKTVAGSTRAAETKRILMLENDINAGGEPLAAAIAALGLTSIVARLFSVNREYDAIISAYIAEKSEAQKLDIVELRRGATKAITQFFDAVQYSAYVYEDLDYRPLVRELSELNLYYSRQLKARISRRRAGKKTSDEAPIPPMPEAQNPPLPPMPETQNPPQNESES